MFCLAGCTAGEDSAGPGGSFTLTPGEAMATYATASWSAPGAASAHLSFSVDGEEQFVLEAVDGESAKDQPVLGMWFGQAFEVSLVDDAGVVRDTQTYTTGEGSVTLGALAVTGRPTWNQYVATGLLSSDPPAALVFGPSGKPVWFWENESGEYVVRVAPRRAQDGMWVLLMPDAPTGAKGRLVGVAWDGSVIEEIIPYGHAGEGVTHDFLELEDGRLLFIAIDTREVDGVSHIGEALYEFGTDGSEREVWSFWDSFTPEAGQSGTGGWTHANSLRWHEGRGTVWMGSRMLNCIVEIEPEEGVLVTAFGGPAPTVLLGNGTEPPSEQHHFDFSGDRLLLHDNRDVVRGSRVVEYSFTFGEETVAEQVWEFVPSPVLYDFVLGDAAYASDDELLVTWSTAGLIEQRSRSGEVPWSSSLLLGTVYGYSELMPGLPGSRFVGNGSSETP